MSFNVTVTPFQLSSTETWTASKFNQGFNPTIEVTGNLSGLSDWNSVNPVSKTFTATDLALDVLTATAHGLTTGQMVTVTSSGTLPTGLSSSAVYYARALTADTVTLHYTSAGASADTNRVDVSAAGSGTHTLTYTVFATGKPLIYNSGTSKWEYGIVQAASLPVFIGATSTTAGVRGAMPDVAPADRDKYFKGDGTMGNPALGVETAGNHWLYHSTI